MALMLARCYLVSTSFIKSYLFMNNTTNLNVVHIELDIDARYDSPPCGPIPAAC